MRSGGEYAYYLEALGNLHPFWGPLPAFLFSWITILLIQPAGLAFLSLSVAKYTVVPILDELDVELCADDLDSVMKMVGLLYFGIDIETNHEREYYIMNCFKYCRNRNGFKWFERQLDYKTL